MKTLALLSVLATLPLAAPARALEAAASPWSHGTHSAIRLIAGATSASGKQRVGVEIVMAAGFKTYWRNPGDSGLPPTFDWSGSDNVGGLEVRWPAPERFDDAAGFAVGYVGEVVVPVSIVPVDPQKPVTIVLKLDYAVCEKLCIPASGEARLWLEPGVTAVTSPRLEIYEARVPVAVKPGPSDDRIAILEAKSAERGLKFMLRAPPGGAIEDVFVEGPGMWSFGKPMLSPQPDGTVTAAMRIKDRPKGASGPLPFIVTVRGKPAAVETRLELDIPPARP